MPSCTARGVATAAPANCSACAGKTAGSDRARRPVTTPPVLERAQVLIAASAGRGSTAEERAAAVAWLTAGATPAEVPMSEARQESSMHASLTRDQVDACGRLHRRIRVRTEVIRRVLEPDVERCEQIEVVLDLLIDIRASETLETLLEDARPVTRPMA